MFNIVTPTRNRPPRSGLRAAVTPITDTSRWEDGLTWRPDLCGPVHTGVNGRCTFSGFGTPERGDEAPQYTPPTADAFAECSLMGGEDELAEAADLATRLLDNGQWAAVEAELWLGTQARAAGYPNAYLASPDAVLLNDGDATAAVDALGLLEQGLATCSAGGVGMIHATPYTTTVWSYLGLLERLTDGRIITVQGTLVVNGAGYDGSGPGTEEDPDPVPAPTGQAWAYATGMVDVRLGAEQSARDRQGIDARSNSFAVGAWRHFAATFDPCCHLGVLVDLTDRA